MMTANKILAVSFIAMLAVSTANATVVTQTNIVGSNGVGVGVVAVDGVNKVQVKSVPAYGVGGGAASSAAKTATIEGLTSLEEGQIIVVNPTTTTTSESTAYTLAVNNFPAKPITRNGTAVNTKTLGTYVWTAGRPSVFVYDGTNWAFIGGFDLNTNTTYSALNIAEARAGTLTTGRTISAKVLSDAVKGDASHAAMATQAKMTGYEKAATASDVVVGDTVSEAIGKLEKKADDAADAAAAAATAQVNSDWNATSGKAQILNKPTLATVATSGSYDDLSNKPTIPAAQVNSDWNATSGKAQILNKPTLGTAAAKNATDTYSAAGTDVVTGKAVASAISGKANSADLATVATSGSYNDLDDKPTIPTVNNKTLTITQGGANAQTFTANSASDVTVDITAAKVGADAAGAAATAKSNIETKLAAGANGYDINAKSLKVNGTAVLTSHQDISGKQNKLNSGTGGNVTITNSNSVTTNGVVKTVTASDGTVTVTRGTVATNDIANSAVGANQLASNAVTTAKITDANVTAPKLADGVVASGSSNVTVTRDSSTKVFKVSVTEQDISGKQDKNTAVTHTASTAAGDASTPVYVASNGAATAISTFGSVASGNAALLKGGTVYTEVRPAQTNGTNGTGYLGAPASTTAAANLTALDTAIKEIHPKDKSVKIPSGSETASNGFASIWVE